jgi:hypothetical protein
VFAAIAALVASPLLATPPPQFVVPAQLPPATAGTEYTYYFCKPIAATKNGVCGSLKTASTNPSGGDGQPYIFKLAWRGFPPNGLALSNRTGILRGKLATNARAGIYRFQICAYSNRGNSPGVCRNSALQVRAAPKPADAFAGTWKGTYTGHKALQGFCGGAAAPLQGDATFVIEKAGTQYSVEYTLVKGNVVGCATAALNPLTYSDAVGGLTMTAATGSTLTGGGWALTLTGPKAMTATWVATVESHGSGWDWRVDATLAKS